MNRIEYKQAVYANSKFDHWHYWGFMPDLSFRGPDMVNGIAHALANSHPYVCDDKNGDKVFSGDEVRHNDFDNGAGTVEPLMMSGIFQGWTVEFYFPEDTERNAARIGDSNDIELIEEKP